MFSVCRGTKQGGACLGVSMNEGEGGVGAGGGYRGSVREQAGEDGSGWSRYRMKR